MFIFLFQTMESELMRKILIGCLLSFSDCITAINIMDLELGSQFARKLFLITAEQYPLNQMKMAGVLRLIYPSHFWSAKLNQNFSILVIDDNSADIILLREVFKKKYPEINVLEMGDLNSVEDVPSFIGDHENDVNIILLDLNMPKVSGLNILTALKDSYETKHIPVIIFSSSQSQKDVEDSYNERANSYVHKPIDLPSFIETVEAIYLFWVERNIYKKFRK